MTEKTRKGEILFPREHYNNGEIIKGYSPSKNICFIRFKSKYAQPVEEVAASISHLTDKFKDPSELRYAVDNFIKEKMFEGFGASLYKRAGEPTKTKKKKQKKQHNLKTHPHSIDNLLYWQESQKQPF